MDQGVSRFLKSPPQWAEQVNICSPTWLQDQRVVRGRRAGGGGSKAFQTMDLAIGSKLKEIFSSYSNTYPFNYLFGDE